jgi:hypothetical protein
MKGSVMRLIASTLIVLAVATFSGATCADDAPDRSPELEVLARFVGEWDIRGSVTPAGGEAVESEGFETRKWSQAGGVVLFENANPPEFHMLLTYDADSAEYIGMMMSGPSRGTVTGEWNAATETMSFLVTFPDGNRYVGTNRFIDDDHVESTGTITNRAGDVLVEMSMDQTRRAE